MFRDRGSRVVHSLGASADRKRGGKQQSERAGLRHESCCCHRKIRRVEKRIGCRAAAEFRKLTAPLEASPFKTDPEWKFERLIIQALLAQLNRQLPLRLRH